MDQSPGGAYVVRRPDRTPNRGDMTHSEYQELAAFFVDHGRFKDETRTIVEVTVESVRHEIRVVADGVLHNGRRIEEIGRRFDENTRRLEEHGLRLDVNTRRVEGLSARMDGLTDQVADLATSVPGRFAHHDERIRQLE